MMYFLTPDDASSQGGIRVIYDFVSILGTLGLPAAVWHGQPRFRSTSFESSAVVVNARQLALNPGDILIVPEIAAGLWGKLTRGVPKVVLNQGHFLTIGDLPAGCELIGDYPGSSEVVSAIATSHAIHDFLTAICAPKFPIHHVPVPLDTMKFRPAAKEPIVAWMPRRRATELRLVVAALQRRRRLEKWSFQAIDGMKAHEVAAALGRASIFLLGNEREGLGLPGLEAMSAGCYAVGFLGGGGEEYRDYPLMREIGDGDLLTMIERVEQVALSMNASIRELETCRSRELIAAEHGATLSTERLSQVFSDLIRPDNPARIRKSVTVSHFETIPRRCRRALRASIGQIAGRG